MADEQGPGDQYGPFSGALLGPLTPQSTKPTPAYAPSKAGAVALFANKFLTGLQQGRRTAYERSEQTKAEHRENFNTVYAHILKSDQYSPEAKRAAEQVYNQTMGVQINEAVKGADKAHADNPIMALAKSVGQAMAGPGENKKHKDYGDSLNALVAITRDPKFQVNPQEVGALENALKPTQQAPAGGQQPSPAGATPQPAQPPTGGQGGQPPQAWERNLPRVGTNEGTFINPSSEGGELIPGIIGARQAPGTTSLTQSGPVAATPQPAQPPAAQAGAPSAPAQTPPAGTTPPPGTTAEAATAPKGGVPWTSQQEALADPRFVAAMGKINKAGLQFANTELGQVFNMLPKAGATKWATPYTVMEGEGENKHPALYRRGINTDGSETIERLGEGKEGTGNNTVKITSNVVTKKDALDRAKSGETFTDANTGKPISVNDIGEGQQLSIAFKGGKPVYTVFSPKYVVQTVGGLKYATTAAEIADLVHGGGTLLGVAQPDTTSTRQEDVVIDGKLTTQNLQTHLQRNNVGVLGGAQPARNAYGSPVVQPGRATAPPPSSGQQQQPGKPAGASPTSQPQAAPAITPKENRAPGAGRTAPPPAGGAARGLTPAMYEKEMTKITPVREASSQLFGSATDPNVKGLLSFAPLADNPESREKIGGALQIMFNNMHQASGGIHGDGFLSWAKDTSGATEAMAQARSQVLSGALGKFTPQEIEAFDAIANSVSTVIGLRSLTRASASNTSAKALENDLPIIGVNTVSSHQFYDKMAKLATLVQNGAKGILPGALPKDEAARYDDLPSQIAKLSTGGQDPKKTYVAGHVYGGKLFKGGDAKDGSNWSDAPKK